MAATTLVRDLLDRASAQLLDAAPQFTRWTERELVHWLNDGQRAIAKYLPTACSRVDAVKLAAGSRQSIELIPAASIIPGNGDTPAVTRGRVLLSVVRNMGANGATPGRAVRVISREVLDATDPDWHTNASGTPITEYAFDPLTPKVFYVYPPLPAATSWWLELAYLIEPTPITLPAVGVSLYAADGSNATVVSVDDTFVDDLLNYMLARAHGKESESAGNAQLASYYTQAFLASINAQATVATGVNPNLQMLPFAPEVPGAAK